MKSSNHLDHLRIASPCPVGWQQMTGDERVRFCEQCSLRVYNISAMTRTEAETLIANTEGRICARLYRRFDGTIITKDCPVGLRAIRRRVAKVAGAVFAALISVCANVFAYGRTSVTESNKKSGAALGNSFILNFQGNPAMVGGTIVDPAGDPVKGATVTLINEATNQKRIVKSDKKGQYRIMVAEFGPYVLKVNVPHFQPFEQRLELHLSDDLLIDVSLEISGIVGIVTIEGPRRTGIDIDGVHIRINE